MATYSVSKSANKTLSGTTIDTVEILGQWTAIEVVNRSPSITLWVTVGGLPGDVPANPVADGDDCEPVLPNERVTLRVSVPSTEKKIVKLLGSGNPYSVIGTSLTV